MLFGSSRCRGVCDVAWVSIGWRELCRFGWSRCCDCVGVRGVASSRRWSAGRGCGVCVCVYMAWCVSGCALRLKLEMRVGGVTARTRRPPAVTATPNARCGRSRLACSRGDGRRRRRRRLLARVCSRSRDAGPAVPPPRGATSCAFQLLDPAEPPQAATVPQIGALVVSRETLAGARAVREMRAARCVEPAGLAFVVVDVVGAGGEVDGAGGGGGGPVGGFAGKLGSSELRRREAETLITAAI